MNDNLNIRSDVCLQNKIKLGITGSRTYQWYNRIINKLQSLDKSLIECVNVGDASGVDTICKTYFKSKGIDVKEYKPNNYNDPQEFYLRNLRIVHDSDKLIAFWHNESRGTRVTIEIARILGVPVEIVYI